jgi:hypothetical protein
MAAILSALALALALGACGSSSSTSSTSTPAATGTSSAATAASTTTAATSAQPQIGYEGLPLETGPALAPASTTQSGEVDGIKCAPVEQLIYHIHAHLVVYDDGRQYALPPGVGIPGSQTEETNQGPVAAGGKCYYWLHTHTSDGVIHIESPLRAIFTLGNFFDEWHQPLTANRVGDLHGQITAYVNGKLWKQSPRSIPLLPHADIQLNIGNPIPPLIKINWSKTEL